MLLSSPLMELESPDVSSEQSELEFNSSEEVDTSEEVDASEEVDTSEEVDASEAVDTLDEVNTSSEELTSDLEVDEVTETTTEIIYQTSYSSSDLVGIESCLQVIVCLLFFIVIFIVCKICRSILDILGF